MLHRAWSSLLTRRGIPHRSPGLDDLDLTRPQTIGPALPDEVRLVINCAAYTNVDGAEKEEALATAVNGTGVEHLGRCCRKRGAVLVHYSTDYVFGGRQRTPYRTDDRRDPLGAYGRSKALGEELLQESGCEHLLIRTSWLYAPWGKNFVRTIAALVREKRPLRVVNDQTGRPTSSEHLARASLELIERGERGIWHVTDGGQCTWFEFACEIARLIDPQVEAKACTTAELARPAPRPAYAVLDLRQTEAVLGPMPHWKANLAEVMARLE